MIVNKIEGNIDRKKVTATTFQMQNCFQQFYDGLPSERDVHCYFQHQYAASFVPKNGRVLDVCCGRGMLIPFLRYGGRVPSLYVGVDIHPKNAVFKDGKDPRRAAGTKDWGFKTAFVESNVDTMSGKVILEQGGDYDLIVYTSAIEHMQPESQQKSLIESAKLSAKDGLLYLTCPVTESGQSGYNCQFDAHVYEPKENEVTSWLDTAGWRLLYKVGLCTKTSLFRKLLKGTRLKGAEYIYKVQPRGQALCNIAALYPETATEVAFVCQKKV